MTLRSKRNMTVEMALERLMNMDSDDSGGQSGPENESDSSDDSWVNESSSPDSELEEIPRKNRRLCSLTVTQMPLCQLKYQVSFFYAAVTWPLFRVISIIILGQHRANARI